MSRYQRGHLLSAAVVQAAIRLAWPEARCRWLARELNISVRHAKRLIKGEVTSRQRNRMMELLDERLSAVIDDAQELRAQLRGGRHETAEESDRGAGVPDRVHRGGADSSRPVVGKEGAG